MSVVDDLRAARAEVEKGWCQNTATDKDDNVCIVGAFDRAVASAIGRWLKMYKTLAAHLPSAGGSLIDFNDAHSTTKQDVLNLFDKALADLGGLG